MTADAAAPGSLGASVPARPWTLTTASLLSLVQGVAILGYGLYVMVNALVSHVNTGVGLTEFGGVVLLLMGLLPLLAGRALLQGKRWGRSPAVLIDTLCLAVTWFMVQLGGAAVAIGVLIGLVGVGGVVLLLHPRTTAMLWPDGGRVENGGRPAAAVAAQRVPAAAAPAAVSAPSGAGAGAAGAAGGQTKKKQAAGRKPGGKRR